MIRRQAPSDIWSAKAKALGLSRHCPLHVTCANAASAWGSQKVMSIDRYICTAVESALRACSRWPAEA